ncbi:MAG: hypothetical protein JXB15_09225 [Anaerolineales bacterium]|nr:hypothetical protein [Anaerolineales bacterium]
MAHQSSLFLPTSAELHWQITIDAIITDFTATLHRGWYPWQVYFFEQMSLDCTTPGVWQTPGEEEEEG